MEIDMLIVIDAGNTNITLGVFQGETLLGNFRMTTKLPRTSDEYGIIIRQLLQTIDVVVTEVTDVIIASVVPNIMHSLINGIIKYFNVKPMVVGPGIKTGIKICTANPKELGADRIVDAVGAYELYGGPVLVIDFGTATTHDLILENGDFVAGVTSPGIRTSANGLWNGAARLPEIEIKKPDTILCKDTVSSMRAGIVYGAIGQTEYIIKMVKEESKLDNLKVVATGGLGRMIAEETDSIDLYDPMLTLKGLKIIYEKQR